MSVALVSNNSAYTNAARIVEGRLPVSSGNERLGGSSSARAAGSRTETALSENRFLDYEQLPEEYFRARTGRFTRDEDSFGGFGGVSVSQEIGEFFVSEQEQISTDLQPSDYMRGVAAYEESTERLTALRAFLDAVRPAR